jgi:hypothetical protein
VDLLSKLNPAAKEFVPSSATPRKALSADAPVFYYGSVGNGGIGAYPAGADTAGYIGNQQQRMVIKIPLDSFGTIWEARIGAADLIATFFCTGCCLKIGYVSLILCWIALSVGGLRGAVVGVLWRKASFPSPVSSFEGSPAFLYYHATPKSRPVHHVRISL